MNEYQNEEIKFNALIPELSVRNIEKSKAFYLSLGFSIRYERKQDNFIFLELERNQIMIEQLNDHWNTGKMEYPFGRGINISMEVDDLMNLYWKIKKMDYPIFKDIMVNVYQVNDRTCEDKEFLIQDPDGYLLRFTQA